MNKSTFNPQISNNHYVDTFKGMVLRELKSVISRKTCLKGLLTQLQDVLLEGDDIYLVTADVSSLYTNIKHKDSVSTLKWA